MSQFIDSKERKWAVIVDVPTIKRLKSELQFDLPKEIATPGAFDALANDPVRLVDMLWLICREQAKERGVSDDEFAAGLFGDGLGRAVDGLVEAIIDFFPNARLRELWKRDVQLGKQREEALLQHAETMLTQMNQQADAILRKRLEESGARYLTALEGSALNPAAAAP